MGNVSENFLDAAEILIDQSINKASYNRTIQAQIISCEDATIGKYKCRYQDAIIYAYSENPDVTYNEKTFVYIDIPGNDMSKDKFIRGTSKRLGINYISQAEGDQAYDIIGINCLTTNTTFYLKSECKDYKYTIYKYKKSTEEQSQTINNQQLFDENQINTQVTINESNQENNEQSQTKSVIQLNITALEQYIKQSSSLIVGATFKTSLNPKQQYRGHYGITYNLCFFDNALNREVIRSYTVDEDNMVDNPYRLIYPTRQYEIFDIDGPNFDHIESIEIFCKDFPNATKEITEILLSQGDIEITNLELTGAVRMADSEINGVAISFYTPQGTFFTDSDEESTEKAITAQVRVKGKLASSAQNIPFYWGIQNVGITPDSEYYNKYLGRGWRCLNDKNVIQTVMVPIEMTDIFFINKKEENVTENENIGENEKQNYYYYKDISNKIYVKTIDKDNNVIYELMTPAQYDNLINLQIFYEKNNVLEWIPSKDTYVFNKNNATARNNKLKVAIVYDGTVVTKTITIQNLGKTVPILTIESSDGTQFYYDVGHPTLTCKVNGEQDFSCRYQWSYEDRHGFGKISTEIAPCEDEIYFEQKEEKTNLKQYETDLKNIANALYSDQDEIKKELKNKINELEVLVKRQKTIERKDNEIINELNTTIDELNKKIKEKFNEINDENLLNQLEKNNKENYSNNLKKLYRNSFQISENLSDDSNSKELKKQFQDLMDEFENQTFTEEPQQKDYIKMLAEAAQLQLDIINGEKYLNGSQENVQKVINAIDDFKFKQRASGNKIYDVQIRNISSFKTFKCSVYNKDGFYLGTASITLTNKLQAEDLYSLVINNGSVTFQYDEDGIAPTSKSLQNPQQIQALSFTIYDNLGNPIDSEVVQKSCEIEWRVPRINTLIVDSDGEEGGYFSPDGKFTCYKNKLNLLYNIANGYNIQKQNNQIELTVKYNEMNLTTRTNFTFVKQGEPGTNGTQYVVKIVPNTKMNNPPLYPMITKIGTNEGASYRINYGIGTEDLENTINTTTGYQLFKAQLWHGGQKVWEGFSTKNNSLDDHTKPTLVNWEILQNSGNKDTQQKTSFEIKETDSGDGKIRYKGNNYHTINSDDENELYKVSTALANIIKCSIKWEDKLYYGTIPIITAWVTNEDYRVKLKDNTGFRYVTYTSDGINPQYDKTNPFEFICMKKNIIDEDKNIYYWEDISLLEGMNYTSGNNVGPNPAGTSSSFLTVLGRKTDKDENGKEKENLIEDENSYYRKNCEKNQWIVQPVLRYDGDCVNAAIWCTYSTKDKDNNTTIIGRIHIPIHLLLNKYGMAHINEWDGNSVKINNEGGYILSPQMGAGTKNNNTFTGVLMGEVKEAGKSNKEIGLFGYANGARSFFLDSKTGAAILGKNVNGKEQGRIIIDPSSKKALLFSSNYWNSSNYNENGLPKNYSEKSSGNGMLIDLSTPQIKFGSGSFEVSSKGHLHAADGGDIANWNIGTDTLTGGLLTLNSDGSIYAQSKEDGHNAIDAIGNGFFLSGAGLSIGSRFKVASNGVVYIGQDATKNGGKKDDKGNPVTPNKYWTISGDNEEGNSYISYNGHSFTPANTNKQANSSIYIGTDGISLSNKFSVDNNGNLNSYSGTIGGWIIGNTQLSASNLLLKSAGSIQTKNYATGKTGWKIDSNGSAEFNDLTANKSGSIGGWTIGSSSLKGGSLTLYNSGMIDGKNWFITADGVASFKGGTTIGSTFNLTGFGTINPGGYLKSPNMKMGGAGTPSWINPNGVYAGDGSNKTLKGYFEDLVVDRLDVTESFTFNGHSVKWQNVKVYTGNYLKWSKYLGSGQSFLMSASLKSTGTGANKTYMLETSKSDPHTFIWDLHGGFYYRNLYLLVGDPGQKSEKI